VKGKGPIHPGYCTVLIAIESKLVVERDDAFVR